MKGEIISVGTELLMGQISNTNAQFLSWKLPEVDVYVYYHTVVGDNARRLIECLEIAFRRSQIILLTGGLGPTQDDITKETVAKFLGRELVTDSDTMDRLAAYHRKKAIPMCPNSQKQAVFPEGAVLIQNRNGTAPGCIIEDQGRILVLLPGPPWELSDMFEGTVLPYLREKAVNRLESRFLRIFGIGESAMEHIINDLVETQTNPTIAPYAKMGEITLRVTVQFFPGKESPETLLEPVLREIHRRLGEYIYSDTGESLPEVVARLLLTDNKTLAAAESCTGGLFSSMLTAVPGISKALIQSHVTYSDRSKIQILKVKRKILDTHGAASALVASQMAEGVRALSGADIGLGITGIAGPGGTTTEKPVGLVYIALSVCSKTLCREYRLSGDRDKIRHVACLHAFDLLRRHLTGKDTSIG